MDMTLEVNSSSYSSELSNMLSDFPQWHISLPQSFLLATVLTFLSVVLAAGFRPSSYPTVKGPKPVFLLGNLIDFLTKGPLKCVTTWWKEYGDVFKFRVGLREILVVADPDLVKEVSVKKFKAFRNRPTPPELQKSVENGIVLGRDKYWATARGASLPWFHNKEHLENYVALMTQQLDRLDAELSKLPGDQVIDIHNRLQVLTLDVFCAAAFGATLDDAADTQASQVARQVSEAIKSISIPTPSSILAMFLPKDAGRLLNWALSYAPGTQEWRRRLNFESRERIGAQVIKSRLEEGSGSARTDVLTQLLRSQAKAEKEHVQLTPKELMVVVGELILAGSDTTSNTITFAIFLLACHPDIRRKVEEEIDSLWDTCPPDSVENLEKYKYVNMVVKETLRLYPTGAQLVREAQEDTSVGTVPVPKGGQILFNLWLLHRNPKYFPDPGAFLPERFDPESPEAAKNDMNAYMPFGNGPRMCLGARFALQEAGLALVKIHKKHSFSLSGPLGKLTGKEAIKAYLVETGIIIKPVHGLQVCVSCRDKNEVY